MRDAVREVHAAHAGERAGQHDGGVSDAVDGDAYRVSGLRMLTDRAQAKADRGSGTGEVRDDDERERNPDEDVPVAERLVDERVLGNAQRQLSESDGTSETSPGVPWSV